MKSGKKLTTERRLIQGGAFWALVVLFCLLLGSCSAELSSNLKLVTEYSPRNPKLVATKTYTDDKGNPVVASDKGYATIRYSYTTRSLVSQIEYLDEKGNPVNSSEGYAVCKKEYSVKRLAKQSYFDAAGNPVIGPEGYHLQETTYNGGRHQQTWQYGTDGNPIGVHRITEYVRVGRKIDRVASDTWYDVHDELAAGPDGYARVEYEWSGKGKTRVAYTGVDGKPFYYAKDKYAIMTAVYRDGRIRETRYFGAEEQPIAGPNGYAYVLYSYPGTGATRLEMYYNADDSLYYTKEGYCGMQRTLGVRNRVTERIYYIDEGVRGNIRDGYTRVTYTYTKNGKVNFQKFFDENDNPVIVPSLGYASVSYTYSKGKYLEWTEFRNEKGKLAAGAEGYAVIKRVYTDKFVTKIRYLEADKKTPAACKEGYATVEYVNNEEGKPIRTMFFDEDGKPFVNDQNADEIRNTWEGNNKTAESFWRDGKAVTGKDGIHGIRYDYNGNGKKVREYYYSTEGLVTENNKGYAIVEYEYNSAGNVMCTRYYDAQGELVLTPGQQYAYVRTSLFEDLKYLGAELPLESLGETEEDMQEEETAENAEETDDQVEMLVDDDGEELILSDRPVKAETVEESTDNGALVEYYGIDGKLMNLEAGYAYILRETDSAGHVTRETYFDRDRNPVNLEAGYAFVVKSYDTNGYLSGEAYYDRNLGKVTLKDGYHSYIRENDRNGNATVIAYFDAAGNPAMNTKARYHRIDRTYLDAQHILSEAWYDTEGRPITIGDTYVRMEREFDRHKNLVVERTCGLYGEAIPRRDGYDEIRREYNDRNQLIRIGYYIQGLPFELNGVAYTEREYDEAGNLAVEANFDEEGRPANHTRTGIQRTEKTYLDKDHVRSEAWFDAEGRPVTNGDAYVRIERSFDKKKNLVIEKTFGPDGELAPRNDRYDECRREYDDENRVIRFSYLRNGAPVLTGSGFAALTRVYDEKGLVLSEAYWGISGEPIGRSNNQVHRIDKTYLDKDHVLSEAWFGADGQPIVNGDTYVRIEREFDEKKNLVSERTYGQDGNLIARKDGYDENRRTYDDEKRVIRFDYLLAGEAVLTGSGFAALTRDYDDQGLVIREAYWGVSGEPVGRSNNQIHRIDKVYLDKDHVLSEAWFDAEGQPIVNGDTYVRVERAFDAEKNLISERTYGADGNPIARKDGYDENRRAYNRKNQAVRFDYLLKGALTLTGSGFASMTRDYDDRGLVISEAYFGTDGEPIRRNNGGGYHRIDRTYLDSNHVTSEAWFNIDGQRMTAGDTYVLVMRDFDERKNLISERTYGSDGNLIARKDGYDENRREYNELNQVIRFDYLLGGMPALTGSGYAVMTRDYDDQGLVRSEAYWGVQGEPVGRSNNRVHRIDKIYLDKDHVLSEAWFGANGQPIVNGDTYVRIERTFDEAKNLISERTYGADGNLIARNDKYDENRRTYDEENRVVRFDYLLNGEPVLTGSGYAALTRDYDDRGLVIREAYWGTGGEPIGRSNNRIQRIDKVYLDKDHVLSEAWFDADGQPIVNGDTYVRIEREFDEKKNCTVEKTYGADGNLIARKDGYDENRRVYNDKNQVVRFDYLLNGEPVLTGSGFATMTRGYDYQGLVTIEATWGVRGEPVGRSNNRVHRIDKTYLDKDHVLSEAWFGADGQPIVNGDTYVRIEREFDERKNLITERTFGADGNLIARNDRYDENRRSYDEKNQVIRFDYLLNGEPVLTGSGFASITRVYDDKGLVASEAYFGLNGEPIRRNNSGGYHRIDRVYLDKDHVLREAWFNEYGHPMRTGDTYVRVEREFDENRNLIVEKTYGADGNLIARNDRYDENRRTYNEKNQVIRFDYLLNGQPVLTGSGFASMTRSYDDKGLVALEATWGIGGEPIGRSNNRVHRIVRAYLDKDHVLSEAWFGADGQPIENGDTYVRIEREFDEEKNLISERTYGADGNLIARNDKYDENRRTYDDEKRVVRFDYLLNGEPVLTGSGYAALTRDYDEKGLVTREAYWGVNGEPVGRSNNQIHRIDKVYLDKDHILSEAWFGADGQPVVNGDTYVRIEREFDENKNCTVEKTFGADGNLIARKDKYDENRRAYNEKNQVIRFDYFLNGEPVLTGSGFASMTRSYDDKGLVALEATWGVGGEPIGRSNNRVHRIDKVYLDKDHVLSEAWFGADGQPIVNGDTYVRIEREFDENKNCTVEKTFGADGNLIARKDKYDENRRAYNEKNQVIRFDYFLNGEPVLTGSGFAGMTRAYDDKGLVASEAYFGLTGEPIRRSNSGGYHRIDRTFLDKDHVTSEAWFDENDQPMTVGDTYVRVTREFDEKKNCTVEKTFGADGNLIARKDKYDENRRAYNEKNQVIRFDYFLNGEPVLTGSGFAGMTRAYDDKGLVASEAYFGLTGEPIRRSNSGGYHRIDRTFLNKDHVTSEAWFDENDQPMTLGDTYVRVTREFDERKNCTVEKYFGADGNAIACEAGYDELRRTYNDKNLVVRFEYFLDGNPVLTTSGYAIMTRAYDEQKNVTEERYFDIQNNPVETPTPIPEPTATPTAAPTAMPTATPTAAPTVAPTSAPTATPTAAPTATPTAAPTAVPTAAPTSAPTATPTAAPTATPTAAPTAVPTAAPTSVPTATPTVTATPAPVLQEDSREDNIIRESYYDAQGQVVVGEEGFATRVLQMSKNMLLSESWFDQEGKPMTRGDTYCRVEYTYDQAGNINREKYYDESGAPICCKAGYAIVYREYDHFNRVVYEKYFDVDGFGIMLEDGSVSKRFEYDDDGKLFRTTRYDYSDREVTAP